MLRTGPESPRTRTGKTSVLPGELRLGEVEHELGLEVLWRLDDLGGFPLRGRGERRAGLSNAREGPQWARGGEVHREVAGWLWARLGACGAVDYGGAGVPVVGGHRRTLLRSQTRTLLAC